MAVHALVPGQGGVPFHGHIHDRRQPPSPAPTLHVQQIQPAHEHSTLLLRAFRSESQLPVAFIFLLSGISPCHLHAHPCWMPPFKRRVTVPGVFRVFEYRNIQDLSFIFENVQRRRAGPLNGQLQHEGDVMGDILHEAAGLPALLHLEARQHICAQVGALWAQQQLCSHKGARRRWRRRHLRRRRLRPCGSHHIE